MSAEAIDAVVCGRSLPALQTALDLAEVGLRVVVTGANEGSTMPDEALRDPDGHLAVFLRRVAEPFEGSGRGPHAEALPTSAAPPVVLLRDPAGEWAPQSQPNVLGIPAVTIASETVRLIGTAGALRAYLDRFKPLLTVGQTRELGKLVRSRMGRAVLGQLVDPQVFERYGVSADALEVALAAPGLNEAMSRSGALSAGVLAYAERNVARETRVAPEGGWERLRAALLHKLELYGVRLLDSPVVELQEHEGAWAARLMDGETLEARSAVLDQGSSGEPIAAFSTMLGEVLPEFLRAHASIDIARPGWLEAGRSAVLVSGDWALRVEADSGVEAEGGARAYLCSASTEAEALRSEPEVQRAAGHRFGADPTGLHAELDEALRAAGFSAAEHGEWSTRVAAAPYTLLVERNGCAEALAALLEERPSLLPSGAALHGDDLGAALGWAHRAAVALRRRLLGLEPSAE